ncbi:hypothetical protein [Paenibacillus lutrae]|uniref:Uncharacterized protein n=1 Tax=Paenibacillus lutrae TaxID=2078573 RepID=A0A7X3FLW5_9BACL|nr:hypothetical protein [Paenibacillus lutrae]MVP02126.1 hypothetical protein [Paenibacillus lutrae]
MKDKTMAYLVWLALGLVALGLGITKLWPIFQGALNDTNLKKPTIPTSFIQQEIDIEKTSLGQSFTV